MSWIVDKEGGSIITLRVVPRASRNAVGAVAGDVLKVRLQAPPVDGKANKALTRFIASELGIPPRRVTLLTGQTARTKRLFVEGMRVGEVESALV